MSSPRGVTAGHSASPLPLFQGQVSAPKYQSRNPISRFLVSRFMQTVLGMVREAGNAEVHEIGCGEGHISGLLAAAGFAVRGCDVSEASLTVARDEAERHRVEIAFSQKSIYDLDRDIDGSDTVVCCEVLEHLTDPEAALAKLVSVTKRDLILSVPNEPLWHLLNLARGKYVTGLGNTPGHYQHWSARAFTDFVSRHATILLVRTPLPWTLIHCRPR